jgi:diguanylate cyclase (GGDEF)-like protein
MRKPPLALFSGIGRHAATMVVACGLAAVFLGLLLQAGQQQRLYRDMHQQQLRQAAVQAAQTARNRMDRAAIMLRTEIEAASEGATPAPAVISQLDRIPAFGDVIVLAPRNDSFEVGGRSFRLRDAERDALDGGSSLLLSPRDWQQGESLYLLRATGSRQKPLWVLAELRNDSLWPELGVPGAPLAVLDSRGERHFASPDIPAGMSAVAAARMDGLPTGSTGVDLAWQEGDAGWVGAIARINSASTVSGLTLAVVAMEPDRAWSEFFWSALRSQGLILLLLLLLLAALFAQQFAESLQRPLQQLRRAIAQLPDRRLPVEVSSGHFAELRQLVDAFNRTADAIETQNGMRRVLDELDALLLPGGDYESVIDQVLTRVRAVTRANNVGLALVDPGIVGHGRLYVVNSEGGAPVNRVMLDPAMVAALREADEGLTIASFEPGRHSFLEPLHCSGSTCFWVWPVMASDELAAILTVAYVEPPQTSDRIADTGMLCAQRLGLSLSNSARAERLYRQAHFDPLTQLPNRQLFREQLQEELHHAERDGTAGALLYIDLDHFKRVNDSLGHEAGDKLLAFVAQRLQGCVKEGDTVARLGGDEFTVILRGISGKPEVAAVAERIVEAMRHPMWIGGRDHHVQASIGITLFPEDGIDLDQLLHHADLAMYRAKDLGRSGAVFYSSTIENRTARIADSGLYRAMHQREFSLFYQPQYRIDDGRLIAVEALLRWYRPRQGLISPAEFIPAAEECGIIVDLGGWVIESACTQLAQWRDSGMAIPRMSVNLSRQQLRDPELVNELRRQLEKYRLQPDALEFEMNEAALTDSESAPSIQALSELGVRLTLDDFGTGSTALANLRRYPVSAVKIDRSFVAQLMDSSSAAALTDTIIVMAHSQRKQVVAEGIETLEQLEYLREHHCDMAQGFFLARPMSGQDMTNLLLGTRDRVGRSARA